MCQVIGLTLKLLNIPPLTWFLSRPGGTLLNLIHAHRAQLPEAQTSNINSIRARVMHLMRTIHDRHAPFDTRHAFEYSDVSPQHGGQSH
eukprot:451836-Karenia_brevis.AAC.1